MKATLRLSWELTTEHSASRNGQAVRVDRATGEAFGPADLVQPYPSMPHMPAALAVHRLAKAEQLDTAEQALVARLPA